MHFDGAVIREQGVTFAVVIVKPHVLENRYEANTTITSFGRVFAGMPVILMAQDRYGRATYYGRQDISNFLSRMNASRIPWKRYALS